uniref:Reverse transcriptase domain-containing protein n=1 Tax=Tanacetum cinerariifolium TaxID=118510 RepID=A0A6L2NTI8_TANCI|nr:reverse transcriptase domain-containing protein [Tanacetum cinerariifolium]
MVMCRRGITSYGYWLWLVSSGWSSISTVLGQMTYPGIISPEGFLLPILLVVVIIVTVVIVAVILIVIVVVIVGGVIVVAIIRVVVVIDGVSSILKLSFVIIVTFPSMLLGDLVGLPYPNRLGICIPPRQGIIVDLIGDEDPTDEDGDTEVSVSLGEISLEGKKYWELDIGDSDKTGDGGKTAGRAIITWGGEIALYACMAFIYGSSCKEECLTLADLGNSINLMPLFVWKKLSLSKFTPTRMILELANRLVAYPLIMMSILGFLSSLGRPFLRTARALIDIHGEELTLRVNDEAITFKVGHTMRNRIVKQDDVTMTKSSIEEPQKLKLKDLPSHLEYAFLEGNDKLPVIISKELKDDKKAALLNVLKTHKRAIAWKIYNIKGIVPRFCTYKILMEDDFKPAVQHQRRVNSKIHEVVKKEVIKLLDVGLIYRIFDGAWVNPVHCVPKKSGMNKLNDATRKDHFPLSFMDQILKRLERNEYYCFLNGFSRHFQILINPQDQDKTTYTCPYGTFAYRHMPFGLCNALGAFQRCMMAIFHHMIKETMEVFMNDLSVFGDSFSLCLSHLDKILKRCEDTNHVINWEKCYFMVKEGIVLCQKISKSEIEVDKAKVNVIAKLPHPTFVKGVRSFLGHAGFYRRFIQDFPKIAWPMTHLLEKETLFIFLKECIEAFNIFKKKLTEAPILVAPDWDLPFEIMCDASDFAVGAVLGKRKTKNFQPIHYARVKNLAVDHLSGLENPHEGDLEKKEINETFPLETLGIISSHSDSSTQCNRGTHFCNDQFAKVMLKYGVTHHLSTAYHPQTSGQVEVSNHGLKGILERTVGENGASWSDKLDGALWAFRTAFKTPIGCTPYKLVYEKACHLPIKLEHKAYWALKHCNFDLKTAGDHRKVQMNELNEIRDQAYDNSLIYKKKTKKIHDSKIKNRVFNIGDRVLLFNSQLKIFSGKLKTHWTRPFTVS